MSHLPDGASFAHHPTLWTHVLLNLRRYCEPCVKHNHFHYVKKRCPVCRQKILLNVDFFSVNLILDKLIKEKYMKDEVTHL